MVAIKPTRDFTNNARTSFTTTNQKTKGTAALTVEQFKENQCKSMGIGIGPRHHGECPFGVTAEEYASTGNNAPCIRYIASFGKILTASEVHANLKKQMTTTGGLKIAVEI